MRNVCYVERQMRCLGTISWRTPSHPGFHQLSSAQTYVPRRQGEGVLGCARFRGALASKSNRVDARFIERENKEMMLIDMSCPWMDNRKQEEEEKTLKYARL